MEPSATEAGTMLFTSVGSLQGRQQRSITVDGQERTYILYTPSTYQFRDPAPVVIALHGAGGTGEEIADISGFDEVAETGKFITVYPDGLNGIWTGTDVPFIAALIEEISRIRAVDLDRVYVAGSSNGGLLAGRLACERPDLFAGYAFVKSSLLVPVSQGCQVSNPGSVLVIHGTQDPLIPYEGNNGILPVTEATQFWAEANGCNLRRLQNRWLPNTNLFDRTRVLQTTYASCPQDPVQLLTIIGGGHTWPDGEGEARILGAVTRDIDGSQFIWDFFNSL